MSLNYLSIVLEIFQEVSNFFSLIALVFKLLSSFERFNCLIRKPELELLSWLLAAGKLKFSFSGYFLKPIQS